VKRAAVCDSFHDSLPFFPPHLPISPHRLNTHHQQQPQIVGLCARIKVPTVEGVYELTEFYTDRLCSM